MSHPSRMRGLKSKTVAQHVLLNHLEKQGFEGAPRFLGVDDSDREIVTFIPGEVLGNNYPELEPYMWSDETLVGLARLLRRFHDATEGFILLHKGKWQLNYVDERKHEAICHNDAALYNVVFQNETPAALIDFDMAGPGPRMWIIQRLTTMCDTLRNGAAEGNLAFRKMVDEGHPAHYESEIRFVTDHFDDWIMN